MFVVEDDVKKVGIPRLANIFFCNDPEETCCKTRCQTERVETVINAMEMIQSYGRKEGIKVCTHLVHHLDKRAKTTHICVIGPLYKMPEEDIDKLEKFVVTTIPGVTEQNIVYLGKFTKNDIDKGRFFLDDGGDDDTRNICTMQGF